MPNIPVERSVSAAAGFAFFVTAQDEAVQQAAVEFIKYFINTENSLDFAELTGRLPGSQGSDGKRAYFQHDRAVRLPQGA